MLRAPTGHNASPPCQRRQLRVGQIAAMNHHVNPSAAIIECNKTACPNGSRRRDLACQNRRTVQEPTNNPSRKEKQKQNDTTRTVVACSTIIPGSKRPISARNIHVCQCKCDCSHETPICTYIEKDMDPTKQNIDRTQGTAISNDAPIKYLHQMAMPNPFVMKGTNLAHTGPTAKTPDLHTSDISSHQTCAKAVHIYREKIPLCQNKAPVISPGNGPTN